MTLITEAFQFSEVFPWWVMLIIAAIALAAWVVFNNFDSVVALVIGMVATFSVIISLVLYFSLGSGTKTDMLKRDIAQVGISDVEFVYGTYQKQFVGNMDGKFVSCSLFDTAVDTEFRVVCG